MEGDGTVLIIGSGGREHAISEVYERSAKVSRIIVAPGNDFICYNRTKEVICEPNISVRDLESILNVALKYMPDLVDVAQDDALASGCVDLLLEKGFRGFGPTKDASRIEWDKNWSREFMQRHNILSPNVRVFDCETRARGYVEGLFDSGKEIVYVKASGLCQGKGALKATNLDEAFRAIEEMKNFGEAGRVFLIEEGLIGEEFSYYAISDGENYSVFCSAQDNKTIYNFDLGNQTGGMGVVCPAKVCDPIKDVIEREHIHRAIRGMNIEGCPYRGILYLGGIYDGEKVINIEYNARWGDPECQAVLPGIKNDYFDLVISSLNGELDNVEIEFDEKVRVCVVGASRGYPRDYSDIIGKRIFGIEDARKCEGVKIYGAGMKIFNGKFYTNGGRLFSVVAEGEDILEAKARVYAAMAKISVEGNGLHYRTDIGWRDVERELKGGL